MTNPQPPGEPPFKYVAIMEHLAPGISRPLTVTSDPETVERVIYLIERRLHQLPPVRLEE